MGFFQSLKQDLSEAVGELIGEEEAAEGVKTAEDKENTEAEAGDGPDTAEEQKDGITDDISCNFAEGEKEDSPEEIIDDGNAFADEGNTAEELNALLKDVIQPEDMASVNGDAEEAASALFDSLSDGDEFPFEDNNEVDLAEKLAEEAYKADLTEEEDALASLNDIDINKMLENIQGELNAVQEESFQADESAEAVPEVTDIPEITADTDTSSEEAADDDMLEGQMSLDEMMAMAESLTKDNGAAAEAVGPVVEDIPTEVQEADAVPADIPVEAVSEPEIADIPAEIPAEPEIADIPAEAVSEPEIADIPVEAPAEPEMADIPVEIPAEPVAADTEPAKEKKAKKTTRKKKAKADVSADIGAEELAGRIFSDETAHLSDGMTIRGNIISDGNMEVAGEIDGNIDILGKLNVSGTINGNTKAGELYAEGAEINGNIECSGSVKVGQGAVIIGDVAGTSAVIAGAVKGNIDVHGPVILADSAIVMGDIRSASVQISNGAAVEGMCSQIYAEVSPKNFFKDLKKAK